MREKLEDTGDGIRFKYDRDWSMTDYGLHGSVRELFEFDWILGEYETIVRVLVKEIVEV